MPQLLESMQTDSIQVVISDSTAIDSWSQFFKNLSQMGFIVLLIIFSDSLPKEIQSGTLINVITKGVSRKAIVLAKISIAWLNWTVSYILCSVVCWAYTYYYWDTSILKHPIFALFGSWLFGIFLITVLMLGETIGKTLYGGLLVAGVFVVCMFIVNIIPEAKEYNPLFLTTTNVQLMQGAYELGDYVKSLCVTGFIIVLSIFASLQIFNKSNL